MSDDVKRTTCLEPVWDDGVYRVRCSMGTAGVCARHGQHRPHPEDGRECEPNPVDGYCHTHGVYMDPWDLEAVQDAAARALIAERLRKALKVPHLEPPVFEGSIGINLPRSTGTRRTNGG